MPHAGRQHYDIAGADGKGPASIATELDLGFAARDPQANRAHVDRLFRLWKDGSIAPRVTEVFPFERGGDAIAKMAAREAIGKLVVKVAE